MYIEGNRKTLEASQLGTKNRDGLCEGSILPTLILTVCSLSRYVLWEVDIPSLTSCIARLAGKAEPPDSFAFLHSSFPE